MAIKRTNKNARQLRQEAEAQLAQTPEMKVQQRLVGALLHKLHAPQTGNRSNVPPIRESMVNKLGCYAPNHKNGFAYAR